MKSFDWEHWTPKERSVLCYVIKDHSVLLIYKKRGFGSGKISAPGGHIELGETAQEAAIRETQEEVGITPLNPEYRGKLHFQFHNGHSIYCEVFLTHHYQGTLIETDEALPMWTPIEEIPYEKMWADDAVWLPGVLEGKKFEGFFFFHDDKMEDFSINWL